MKVGMIGLGKLGFPVAISIAESFAGSFDRVYGYDIEEDKDYSDIFANEPYVHDYYTEVHNKHFFNVNLEAIARECNPIFVAVQTPHDQDLDGTGYYKGDNAKDFDYSYLINVINSLNTIISKPTTLCIISTVLPTTIKDIIYPMVEDNHNINLVYNPYFISMGNVVDDFRCPEFVLIGTELGEHDKILNEFYNYVCCPTNGIKYMTWPEAEIVKMTYNTYISAKIVIANAIMELCHKVGANVDVVSDALKSATDRIVSPRYMVGGMGDGGSCHPRDCTALSYLSQKLDLSANIFDYIMSARSKQTKWIAEKAISTGLPIVIIGKSFKKGVNITDGSASILLKNIINCYGVEAEMCNIGEEFAYGKCTFILTQAEEEMNVADGSVILDVWRSLVMDKLNPNACIIRIGDV